MNKARQYATKGFEISSRLRLAPPDNLCKMARISTCLVSIIKGNINLYMYVYLSSDGHVTQIEHAPTPEECQVERNTDILMVLQVPDHITREIVGKWKRESRGELSRVKKGFKLAKQYMLKVFVSDIPIGELETLTQYKPPIQGVAKKVPASFWENL